MSATNFSLDDITLAYSEEDYKPQRKEPVPGKWFEFKVKEASVEQSKGGHLQIKLVTEALDRDGKPMFRKWVNIPVPVSVGSMVAPTWSKGLWLANVRPLFPAEDAFDKVETDEITGKKVYYKNGERIGGGKEYEDAMVAANKRIGEKAKAVARTFIEQGDRADLPDYAGHTVFGKTIASKDGQYINIERLYANLPRDVEAVYDSKEAFGR